MLQLHFHLSEARPAYLVQRRSWIPTSAWRSASSQSPVGLLNTRVDSMQHITTPGPYASTSSLRYVPTCRRLPCRKSGFHSAQSWGPAKVSRSGSQTTSAWTGGGKWAHILKGGGKQGDDISNDVSLRLVTLPAKFSQHCRLASRAIRAGKAAAISDHVTVAPCSL